MPLADRTRSAVLVLVAAVCFTGAFWIADAVDETAPSSSSAKVERLPAPLVKIANLERSPTMKPLRSAPGAAPTPAPQAQTQTRQPTTGP